MVYIQAVFLIPTDDVVARGLFSTLVGTRTNISVRVLSDKEYDIFRDVVCEKNNLWA